MAGIFGPKTERRLDDIEAKITHFMTLDPTADGEAIDETAGLLLTEGTKYLAKKGKYGDANRDRYIALVDRFVTQARPLGIAATHKRVLCSKSVNDLNMEQLLVQLAQELSEGSLVTEAVNGRYPVEHGKEMQASQALRLYYAARETLVHADADCPQSQAMIDVKATALFSALDNLRAAYFNCGPLAQEHILRTPVLYNRLIGQMTRENAYMEAIDAIIQKTQLTGESFEDESEDLMDLLAQEAQNDNIRTVDYLNHSKPVHDILIQRDDFFEEAIRQMKATNSSAGTLSLISNRCTLTGEDFSDVANPGLTYADMMKCFLPQHHTGLRPDPITEEYRTLIWNTMPAISQLYPFAIEGATDEYASRLLSDIIHGYYACGLVISDEFSALVAGAKNEHLLFVLLTCDARIFNFLYSKPDIRAKINDIFIDNFKEISDKLAQYAEHPDRASPRHYSKTLLMTQLLQHLVNPVISGGRTTRETVNLIGIDTLASTLNSAVLLEVTDPADQAIRQLFKELTTDEFIRLISHPEHGALRNQLLFAHGDILQQIVESNNLQVVNALYDSIMKQDIYNANLYPSKDEKEAVASSLYHVYKAIAFPRVGMPELETILTEDELITLYLNLQQCYYVSNVLTTTEDSNWVYNMVKFFQEVDQERINQFFNPERLLLDHISSILKYISVQTPGDDADLAILAALALADAYREAHPDDHEVLLLIAQLRLQVSNAEDDEVEILESFKNAYDRTEEGSLAEARIALAALILYGASQFDMKDEYTRVWSTFQRERREDVDRLTAEVDSVLQLQSTHSKFQSKFS